MLDTEHIATRFNPQNGTIEGATRSSRRLSDLADIYHDREAFALAVNEGDPVIYSVETIESTPGEGDLHYGIGTILPGRVGREYYMTRGHLHDWRPAAEVYIGLGGSGIMLLEHEVTHESRVVELRSEGIVYVPGYTAHRTINVGNEPLVYMGVFPARAGHDYGAIARRNFRMMVIATDDGPVAVERPGW